MIVQRIPITNVNDITPFHFRADFEGGGREGEGEEGEERVVDLKAVNQSEDNINRSNMKIVVEGQNELTGPPDQYV